MGIVVAATLLLGREASLGCVATPSLRRAVRQVAFLGVLLGFLYYLVDLREAFAQKEAAQLAWSRVKGHTVWHTGYWGFLFYAEQAGIRQIVPRYEPSPGMPTPEPTILHADDWVVVPDKRVPRQSFDESACALYEVINIQDSIPLRTLPARGRRIGSSYYGGRAPLLHHDGPRFSIRILKVQRDMFSDGSTPQITASLKNR
jgi:hypothetical protein